MSRRSSKGNRITSIFIKWFGGEFILEKGIDRQAGFIAYIFLLITTVIMWSLMVEKKMVQIEKNEEEIYNLEITYNESTLNLAGINKISLVEEMLEKCSSTLKAPEEPATVIIIGDE